MKTQTVSVTKCTGFSAAIFIALCILFLEGCDCENRNGIETASSLHFVIKDKGAFIFDVYPIDSFRVFFKGQRYDDFSSHKNYGSVTLKGIYNEATDQAVFTSQVCKDFVFRYTFKEIDTIKVCFNAKPDGKCKNDFHVVNVFYKGKKLEEAVSPIINR